MEAVYLLCVAIAVLPQTFTKGASTPQCAGKTGSVMFMPTGIDGNVTGFQRYSKQAKGEFKMNAFANYDTNTRTLTHFQTNRDIMVVNKFNLQFQHLQKSDEGKYSLSLSVSMATGGTMSREDNAELEVQDPCFDPPEIVSGCFVTTCYTSFNGTLRHDGNLLSNMTVRVCEKSKTGSYKCCPPVGECKTQNITDPAAARSTGNENKALTVGLPVGIVVAVIVVAVIVAVLFWQRKRQKRSGGISRNGKQNSQELENTQSEPLNAQGD